MFKVYRRFRPDRRCVLLHGDCLRLLRQIPDEAVSLTFTSPPYCMAKEYEDTSSVDDFLEAHKKVLPEVLRVTREGGSICWQVGYHVMDGEVTPLDFLVNDLLRALPEASSLVLRNRIIWTFGFGLHCRRRFSGRHEVVLWYTKGNDYTFDLDSVRVPQKYPGKLGYKGDGKGRPTSHPLGKNPSDVWNIPNVKANHVEATDHPCQFPIGLVQRAIRALTRPDELVLDPFAGSGTTGAAAIIEGRRFVGAEKERAYCRIADDRLARAASGLLRYRDHDLPVFEPNPRSRLCRRPPSPVQDAAGSC